MRPLATLTTVFGIIIWVCACGTGTIGTGEETDKDVFPILGGDCPDAEGTACVEVPPPPEMLPPEEGGCWVTGIGTFGKGQTRDSFGGNAMTMKDGSVRGEWQHVDHFDVSGSTNNGQNLFHGKVDYIECRIYPTLNGPEVPKAEPNYARWGGFGRFNGVDGYSFEVQAFDHAEGGIFRDRYMIEVRDPAGFVVLQADGQGTRTIDKKGNPNNKGHDTSCREDPTITPDLAWVYDLGCLSGGNFQIHPPNQGHPY